MKLPAGTAIYNPETEQRGTLLDGDDGDGTVLVQWDDGEQEWVDPAKVTVAISELIRLLHHEEAP